jgi:molybdopterin molybdotransferase
MISVDEARAIVLDWCRPLPFASVRLADALGRFLAEPIVADLDLPPFNKALVDGYAVRSSDLAGSGPHRLSVGEEIPAGRTPTRLLASGEAAVIMTGAPLPDGADAVVMHEKTERLADGRVLVPGPVARGSGSLGRAKEMRRGQTILEPRSRLNPVTLGVLASVGKSRVPVAPRPRVAIIPTGDELVPVDQVPGPGQIRETNSTVLAGLVHALHGEAIVCATVRDEPSVLREAIDQALATRPDVLLLCGGVSAGQRDLVPAALSACGVTTLFHKVRVKPGKPILFGVHLEPAFRSIVEEDAGSVSEDWTGASPAFRKIPSDSPMTLVYGLPGNPVSGIVGFLLFVAPALRRLAFNRLMGDAWCLKWLGPHPARLSEPFRHRGDRETFHPATHDFRGGHEGTPLEWAGSSDLLTIAKADGFLQFAAGDRDYEAGEEVPFWWFPSTANLN